MFFLTFHFLDAYFIFTNHAMSMSRPRKYCFVSEHMSVINMMIHLRLLSYICVSDAKFLLRFLRFKKYHIPLAQEALERYLLLRQTFGVAFNCLDITIPMMEELTNLGYIFACPKRDKNGRRVIVTRPGVFDLDKFTNGDMCRIHGIAYETLMEDEENQIRGFVHFADGQGVGFAYLTLFTIKEAVRIVKNGEKSMASTFIHQ
ncbi:unnamed protein product [Callosobruchus maculatus]|uniref:CRAL/TRIO N-terminal domain-containing protein n=1 Tax=Callosobruchus maculatus TaxID=64391 RepID=A0A653CQY0_CALMS|nr:unnamed protein product [Callosobruchus maculatus]